MSSQETPDTPEETETDVAPAEELPAEPVAAQPAATEDEPVAPEPVAPEPAADASPSAADDESVLAEGEPALGEEEAEEAAAGENTIPPTPEAPKRRRRPSRRRGATAETEAESTAETETETAAEEPPPAAPAPTRRRSRRDPDLPAPVVRAQAKYVRSSARKARLVCDHIRGKSVEEARAILAVTPRAIARDWSKLLESAVANAEHNHELVGEDLYVKAVHADEGPTIKRFRPRAMGRATRIRKRTSHLTILLTPKD
jgi:ribosomal protein L22